MVAKRVWGRELGAQNWMRKIFVILGGLVPWWREVVRVVRVVMILGVVVVIKLSG